MDLLSSNRRLHILCTLSLLLLAQACADKEVLPEPSVKFKDVDTALQPYFLRFEQEGLQRGFEVDLTAAGVKGTIEELEGGKAGRCSSAANGGHQVTIGQSFWDEASDLFREFIVFHELGHCYLNRSHLETATEEGTCTSIMRSGDGKCKDSYSEYTREAYIDELFENSDLERK